MRYVFILQPYYLCSVSRIDEEGICCIDFVKRRCHYV